MAFFPSLLEDHFNPSPLRSDTPYASEPPNQTFHAQGPNSHAENPSPPPPPQDLSRPRTNTISLRPRGETTASLSSISSSSSVRRKPLPATASSLATRYSTAPHLTTANLLQPESLFARPYSIDSPTLPNFPPTSQDHPPVRHAGYESSRAKLPPSRPESVSHAAIVKSDTRSQHPVRTSSKLHSLSVPLQAHSPTAATSLQHSRLVSESTSTTSVSDSSSPWFSDKDSLTNTRSTMSILSTKPTPPHQLANVVSRTQSYESNDSDATIQRTLPSLPKSPGGKLGTFFGWGANSSPPSSTTTFSDKSFSPLPSEPSIPVLSDVFTTATSRIKPTAIDIPKANAEAGSYFPNAFQLPLATPASPVQIEEMEKELKEISSELASSIRREMDLEDLVDRLQSETQNMRSPGRRTSDYFSDSGTSSIRYGGEPESKQEELDRAIRRTEQEKAQMRLELSAKVQEERDRRKQLESQIRTLEEKASHVDLASMNSLDAGGRLQELEATCEDLRRRLTEERQVKENFEDLLTALKSELQVSQNERDNLRDEIVPQLRARVEGLEAQAAQHEQMTYEQTKMQQELQTLKRENVTLINSQKLQIDMQQMNRFGSIAEEGYNPRASMTRSNSLSQGTRSRPLSLSRAATVKTTESREALAERVKDIELQRDSLHRALKSLLERQEHQNRENQKRIRQLEMERDQALAGSPKRAAYNKEVANLREEINTLRRRAEDVIEQKWQCEKGLSGLKMDLERAEQEIGSLRNVLHEKDILLTSTSRPRSDSTPVSSDSLERSYRDLQIAYAESLERIKNLEASGNRDAETKRAIVALEKSLAKAVSEGEFAQQEMQSLRDESNSLRDSEKVHVGHEAALAAELQGSAERVEELATQVRQQLASNATLRQRLADTIARGEKEQKANTQKILLMQSKLKSLEDQLLSAQQASEERLQKHEDDVRDLKESHNVQLLRMKDSLRSPRTFGPGAQTEPLFANTNKAPRIKSTTSGSAMSVSQESQMDVLRQKIIELETALADAEQQMQEVVGRMNVAQIAVMELQNDREEAVRETKKLQKIIEAERLKSFEGRFATLVSPVR